MRYITRIHLSDCGWREAYYPGTTIELADPRTGEPKHTVFSLENTGGKTSFLALVLSCFDPSERRFLKTLIHPNQRFGDYFGDVPAFILVEWDLSSGQTSFLDAQRLVTGQLVVPRGEGRQRELDRHFLAFRSTQGLALDDIPAPGLPRFEPHRRLHGHQDVQHWLYTMRSRHSGNFQNFDKQSDWKRKLAEEKIDTELLAAQVEFNRSEGGIEGFLNFRNESQFVQKFLGMTVPEAEAGPVRTVLAEHVGRLADLPRLERRRKTIRELKERFAPFVEIAGEAQAAQDDFARLIGKAAGLKATLEEHGAQASHRAEDLSEEASSHQAAADQAASALREARVESASALVEMARERHEARRALAETHQEELAHAKSRAGLLQGAVLMWEILDGRARSESLREEIDAEHADLQPRRDALQSMGADLKATLARRATTMRERQQSLTADAAQAKESAREAEEQRKASDESAQAERREMAGIDMNLGHVRDFRARLEKEGVLVSGESAQAASHRYAEAERVARDEALDLGRQAHDKDEATRAHRYRQGDLKAESSGIASEIDSLQVTVREGDESRRSLAHDSTIVELTGESEVDPDSDSVDRVLADATNKGAATLRANERRQELLEADRESLEATGLASIDKNVRAVTEQLSASGMVDVQPYAVYLCEIGRSPEEVRRFAELDPARFAGVAVPNRRTLEEARRLLQSAPRLSRSVTVAIAGDAPGENPEDRFVLTVDEPAAYDREAAQELRQRIEDDLTRLGESIDAARGRLERLGSTLQSLGAWRDRFGGGRLDALRQSIEKKEARNEEILAELGALSKRIESDEYDAKHCRSRAGKLVEQAHACAEHARRADEHHKQWESRVANWQLERLRHEQAAQAAEERALKWLTKRDALADKARTCESEAWEAARQATAIEQEAGGIEYKAPGGQVSENLDALRSDYQQRLETLKDLERERVDHLRGRQQEIQRALGEKEDRFGKEFGELDRAEVTAAAAHDSVRDAAATADKELETARRSASIALAHAEAAETDYRSERDSRSAEIKPDTFIDLRAHNREELADIAARAAETTVQQEALGTRETEEAARTRQEAARNESAAKEYTNWATTLHGMLPGESASPERIDLPSHEEVAALVNDTVSGLGQAKAALSEANERVYESYDKIRRFMNSPTLEGEREVAVHLSESDPPAAAAQAPRTARLIDDRLKSIEHDLSRLDDDLQACIEELEHLLGTALHIVRRMVRGGRIPDDVPRFGGQPVFRISADLSRISPAQRREILRSYITDLVEDDRGTGERPRDRSGDGGTHDGGVGQEHAGHPTPQTERRGRHRAYADRASDRFRRRAAHRRDDDLPRDREAACGRDAGRHGRSRRAHPGQPAGQGEQDAAVEDADRTRGRDGNPALLRDRRSGHERACCIREHREAAPQSAVPHHGPHPCGDRGDARAHRQEHGRRTLRNCARRGARRLTCPPSKKRSSRSASAGYACTSFRTSIFAPTRTPSMRPTCAGFFSTRCAGWSVTKWPTFRHRVGDGTGPVLPHFLGL